MPVKPLTGEIATISQDPMVAAFQSMLTPTDATLRLRGAKGLSTYDEIRRDPHAFAVLQKRTLEVCSREWSVKPASERRLDKKAAEMAEAQFKGINFDKLTRGMIGGAVLKGFSVGEVIWQLRAGIWTVAAIKVRKQRRFGFTIDGELRHLTRASGQAGEALPDRKFIVHRHSIEDDDDDPYGVGLGSVLYWPAWFKRQVLGNWLRATERFASPTVHATYSGSEDKKKTEELLNAIRRLANDAGIVTPDGVTLNLLEASAGGGGDHLEKLSRYLDELMSEAVLGETLSTNSGERGARSLGEIHNEVRLAIAKADADLFSQTLKETVIRWMVEINMPGAGIPDLWRDFSEEEDLDERVVRDRTVYDMGYKPKDVTYINETYGGDWIEKQPPTKDPADPNAPVGEPTFMDALFNQAVPSTPEQLAADLERAGEPVVNAMIEAISREVQEALDFDDLSNRLLRLGSELAIDDLGVLMEHAMLTAELSGRHSVLVETNANG